MIPTFPQYKKLELTDRELIKSFMQEYPPYSDFNFVSLWSWDTKGEAQLSTINKNLVVRLTDYVTGQPCYSFLGNDNLTETINTLLRFIQKEESCSHFLKLIPEECLPQVKSNDFVIEEDRDNFDYLYEVDKLRTFQGSNFERLRTQKNRFLRENKNIKVINLDLKNPTDRKIVLELNQQWEVNKGHVLENEESALTRILFPTNDFNLLNIGIFVDNAPVAFSISEVLENHYAISHFVKADINYPGVYSYLMSVNADALSLRGCSLLNYEQDLGIEGLRKAKLAFRPLKYLRKYIVKSMIS